ncbi:MAG: flagellar hook-length control protein FliK [Telluria sp.]
MNLTLTSFNPTPPAAEAPPALGAVAAPGVPDGALPATAAQPVAPAPGLPGFAQWLAFGLQAEGAALPADGDATVADAGSTDEKVEAGDAASADIGAAAAPDGVLLAAMATPLTLAPAAAAFGALPARDPAAPAGSAAGGTGPALALSAAELRTGMHGAQPPAAASDQPALSGAVLAGAAQAGTAPATPDASNAVPATASAPANGTLPAPVSLRATAPHAFQASAAAANNSSAAVNDSSAPAAVADAAPAEDGVAASTERPAAATWGVGASAPAASRAGADSVVLAGPPAAWRQSLHEALGERLSLQLTKNSEQAVIRLDPPMLGRIEIAIRHTGGTLEVTLSATHSEVLRQLHAVSDTLRNDLAQRQFTEVALTVAPARGNGNAPSGEQQGRGRQPGRDEQPQDPGRALAEAGDSSSTFSLNGRA